MYKVFTEKPKGFFAKISVAACYLEFEGKLLVLKRNPRSHQGGTWGVPAGKVEQNEKPIVSVAREVFEETGIKIRNIQYKYSQPWPFPSSLMLGFHAEAYDKKLHVDYSELEKAEWFSKEYIKDSPENEIFKLPGKISIARRLITDWINN